MVCSDFQEFHSIDRYDLAYCLTDVFVFTSLSTDECYFIEIFALKEERNWRRVDEKDYLLLFASFLIRETKVDDNLDDIVDDSGDDLIIFLAI